MFYLFVAMLAIFALVAAHLGARPLEFDDPFDRAVSGHILTFPGGNVEELVGPEMTLGTGLLDDIDLHDYFPKLSKAGPFILTFGTDNDVLISQPPRSSGSIIIFGTNADGVKGNYCLPTGTPRRLHDRDHITIQLEDGTECCFRYEIR